MPKPFLSFEEQIEHLELHKNLEIPDKEYAIAMLRQIGYFSLISGYKTPFKNPTTKKYSAAFSVKMNFSSRWNSMVVSSVRWISVTPVLYHNSTNFATVQKQGRLLEFLPVGTECYEGLVGKEGEQDKGNAVSP